MRTLHRQKTCLSSSVMTPARKPMPPDAKVIEAIRLEVVEGEGIEEDPCRRVIYYYAFDGRLLARNDDWWEEEQRKVTLA